MKTDKEMAEYVMNHYGKSRSDIICLGRHLERWREERTGKVVETKRTTVRFLGIPILIVRWTETHKPTEGVINK